MASPESQDIWDEDWQELPDDYKERLIKIDQGDPVQESRTFSPIISEAIGRNALNDLLAGVDKISDLDTPENWPKKIF